MQIDPGSSSLMELPDISERPQTLRERIEAFPWWLAIIIVIIIGMFVSITIQDEFRDAFVFIVAGIGVTIYTALTAYALALVIGLIAGLGRLSSNFILRNLATVYVEIIRGIPMLVLIFYIALVGVPTVIGALQGISPQAFGSLDIQDFPMDWRAIIALAITYGAFLAEIFRAGIESIERGQMEAARSLGMSYAQAMRYIILPQAIRNVLPALGNDFVAMVKDTSLVSVLAVRDITQVARLYAGRSFRFGEAYTILAVLYLTMTFVLSLLVRLLERRLRKDQH